MFSKFITFLKAPIQPEGGQINYNYNIEMYRGACALLVMIEHAFVHPDILIENFKWNTYFAYLGSGYLSVMIFFGISGYVIGSTTSNNHLSVFNYLKKRVIRLYPIYLIAIVMCFFIAPVLDFKAIIWNMLFLQNSSTYLHFQIPLFINFPTWSLNYEVLYYLLFIPIFFLKPKVWAMLLILFSISALLISSSNNIEFIANYNNGFYFWLLGLLLGWKLIKGSKEKKAIPLLSLLFLHLCQNHLGIGKIILNTLNITTTNNLNWLFDLPFCLMVLSKLSKVQNRFLKINSIICYFTPAIVFFYLSIHHRIFENERWIMCLIFWVLSLLLLYEKKISFSLSRKLITIGKISYAIYLFHIPLALIIKDYIVVENKKIEVIIKYSLWIFCVFLVSYLAEMILQPKIKSYFFKHAKTFVPLLSKAKTNI